MQSIPRSDKHTIAARITVALGLLLLALAGGAPAYSDGPPPQPPARVYDEMRTVYLGNLARQAHRVPPLRWNAPMTEAARWFSWDSVENRPPGYCGHQDTLGRWPSERVPAFGYRGYCGAENCFCGYVTPEYAIEGWMNSPGHRANLLDPNSREVGLGYYRRAGDGSGYVSQDFGHDPVYPPVVIENEALTTTSPAVNLHIYDREGGGGFAGLGPTVEMRVANEPCFAGVAWEPYTAERTWTLEPGTGWRTVYVQTRDAVSRTTVVSDTIYLGANVPLAELGLHLASANSDQVTLYGLDGSGLPYVQFSQNWFVDDTFETFALNRGNGERVNDAAAWGGTAFRLRPGDGESFAWAWTTEFFKDIPFVAYIRLKVSDNTSASEVARVSVNGGGTEYGPLHLKGTDFDAADAYQEFALPFTFHDNPDDVFLILNFWRSGSADVYVDGVSVFTAPQPVQPTMDWAVPGGNYRGGGAWVRYTDGAGTFSAIEEGRLIPQSLRVTPSALQFMAEHGGTPPPTQTLTIQPGGCEPFAWNVSAGAAWLQVQAVGETVQVRVETSGMVTGTHQATVTITAETGVLGSPVEVPVTLVLAGQLYPLYLPVVLRAF